MPVPARRPSSQSAADTAGLKCAPEIGPNIRIRTANPNTVAVEFSSSCSPTSSGESCAAAMPDLSKEMREKIGTIHDAEESVHDAAEKIHEQLMGPE